MASGGIWGDAARWALALTALLLATFVAAQTHAQGSLDAARAALEDARFADAERLYSQAASSASGLSRDDVLTLFRERALARAALRDTDGARADLIALLSIEPSSSLGQEAPPSLQRIFTEARSASRGPLSADVQASATDGGFEIRTTVTNDPAALVRDVRVYDLSSPGGAVSRGPRVTIAAEGELSYAVELVGPGGAVLIREGSAAQPRVARRALAPAGATPVASSGDDSGLWIGLGVGAGLAVALAVVLTVVFVTPSGRTQPGRPMEVAP